MNELEIQKRIRSSGLEEADAIEVFRIFQTLPHKKRVQVFDQWSTIIASIRRRRQQIEMEKSLLLEGTLTSMYSYVETYETVTRSP
jgi:hypothetical protein